MNSKRFNEIMQELDQTDWYDADTLSDQLKKIGVTTDEAFTICGVVLGKEHLKTFMYDGESFYDNAQDELLLSVPDSTNNRSFGYFEQILFKNLTHSINTLAKVSIDSDIAKSAKESVIIAAHAVCSFYLWDKKAVHNALKAFGRFLIDDGISVDKKQKILKNCGQELDDCLDCIKNRSKSKQHEECLKHVVD